MCPGVDGRDDKAIYLGNTPYYTGSDTGLPTGGSPGSIGGWAQVNAAQDTFRCVALYGMRRGFYYQITSGRCHWDPSNLAGTESGEYYSDGRWHFFVLAAENPTVDGAYGKMYVDGVLIGTNVAIGTIALQGAAGLRIGVGTAGSDLMYGNISTVFITNYAMSPEEVFKLYAKPGIFLDRNPVDPTTFIEAMTDTHLYLIGDTLDPRSTIEVRAL